MNKDLHIDQELRELGSNLHRLPKTMPHHVPQEYFKHIHDRLSIQVNAKENNTFSTPNGYFNTLPEQILEKAQKQDKGSKVVSFSGFKRVVLAAAAMLLILLSIGIYNLTWQSTESTIAQGLNEIPQDIVLAYVEENINEFDTELITNTLDENTIPSTETLIEYIDTQNIKAFLNNSES